jgi:transcriptional activator SPT7
MVAKERFHLFKDGKLNVEAPALIRNKVGMRRFLKHQKDAESMASQGESQSAAPADAEKETAVKPAETLADGIDDEADRVIPDYYNSLTNIPDIHPKLQWTEDSEGQVINHHEEFLRLVPEGTFTAPSSRLTKKMDDNIHQIQETRKLATKISVIKQMQVQTQVGMMPLHGLMQC